MRLCSFIFNAAPGFGVLIDPQRILDLPAALREGARNPYPELNSFLSRAPDLKSWLGAGVLGLEVARRLALQAVENPQRFPVYSLSEVQLLAPIPNPTKMIAIGLNYRDHAEEQNVPLPKTPLIFAKFPSSVVATDLSIQLPPVSRQVDVEAELCVVMLSKGRRLTPETARQAIAGYTIGNDVSARDLQYGDKQWVRGKSCDTFAPLGPYLVTADQTGDPHDLKIQLRVNGEVRQSSTTRNLIFNCYELVAFISDTITLEPGDVIFTGTPAGVGVFRKPPVFLKDGDVVEVEIEKLGVLRNPVSSRATG